jgi:hypothetical protein
MNRVLRVAALLSLLGLFSAQLYAQKVEMYPNAAR